MSTEEVKKEEAREPTLPELLNKLEGAPDQEQRDAWKLEYGEIFVSGFSPEELYVFRPISRPEYCGLQVRAQEEGFNQFQMEEATCDICVLWPVGGNWNKGKAGTPQSLSEMIMQNSNFLSPAAASMLVAKL